MKKSREQFERKNRIDSFCAAPYDWFQPQAKVRGETMSTFKVFPIPEEVTRRIRETRIDDFGHQLSISVATENDTGPCRNCLAVFVPGEGRLLFSYAPNQCDHPYNEIGP